jgi:hypothetical protein
MAARGTRNMDTGEESIKDEGAVKQLRLQARRIQRRAMILAIVLTLITIVFP